MKQTVIHFERVGRSSEGPIKDVVLTGHADVGHILHAIEAVASKRLRSSSWEIGLSDDLTKWDIEFGRFGNGTVEFKG